MRPIALTINSRRQLRAQTQQRQEGHITPIRWHEVLDDLSYQKTGLRSVELRSLDVWAGRAVLFSWQPTYDTVWNAVRRRGLVYLCWGGVTSKSGWKKELFRHVLVGAEQLLVNDVQTQKEIKGICGRDARRIPFFVDFGFFSFMAGEKREEFVFCNGTNDRDISILVGLAERGFKVVWLVQDLAVYTGLRGRYDNLEVRLGISFEELRELYQTCFSLVTPLRKDSHCAGQTTALEAIACGAPVLISASRTATIVEDNPAVIAVASKRVEEWAEVLMEMRKMRRSLVDTWTGRQRLQEMVSRERLTGVLEEVFR